MVCPIVYSLKDLAKYLNILTKMESPSQKATVKQDPGVRECEHTFSVRCPVHLLVLQNLSKIHP